MRGGIFLIDDNHILFLQTLLNVGMDMNEERKHFDDIYLFIILCMVFA